MRISVKTVELSAWAEQIQISCLRFIVGDETEIRRLGGCKEPFEVEREDQGQLPGGGFGKHFYISGVWSLHLGNFCFFTVVGLLSQSLVPDFIRFSSNFNWQIWVLIRWGLDEGGKLGALLDLLQLLLGLPELGQVEGGDLLSLLDLLLVGLDLLDGLQTLVDGICRTYELRESL